MRCAATSALRSSTALTYNDWYSNTTGDLGGSFSADAISAGGNLTDDPLFWSYTLDGDCDNDVLVLLDSSTLIDAGDPAGIERELRRGADTEYHPVGTCRMGPADHPAAVVGPDLRVHGVDGLRVADASIMPNITTGNTNAPSIMIGEKCADLLRA